MPIITLAGDLFTTPAEAIINPVNCVGVCGKGLALEFKTRFPANFAVYRDYCDRKLMIQGKMLVTEILNTSSDRKGNQSQKFIVNFPSKRHWIQNSKLQDIFDGIEDLQRVVRELKLNSIALPAIGCGLGGLDWRKVEPIIRQKLDSDHLTVYLFPPQ
jgi:O-acetyl-ADP-ribose deacetylase (regulator of RNase III)